jgi:hypothetical protein
MANEKEIAELTDRVAQIMNRARYTLDYSVDALSDENFGRTLDYRMQDVAALTDAAEPVQEAEFEAEVQRRLADRTQDPRDAESARKARDEVVRPFTDAQAEGQGIVRRINAAQEQLSGVRQDLQLSARQLDEALTHVAKLKTFTESRTTAYELHTRVSSLQTLTENANAGLGVADQHLENVKGAAQQFGRADTDVDRNRLSKTITQTAASLQGDLTKTGDGLGTVRKDLADAMPDVHENAEYSHKQAELADAMRAGMNPPPGDAQTGDLAAESENGVQDARLRIAQRLSGINNER